MERISRGEVWIIEPVGYSKPRPALVISVNPINDLCPDVLVVPITTKEGPLRILLSEQPTLTGLKMRSFAKCESLGPVHKARLKKRIGRVSKADFLKIEEGVKKVLGF